VIISVSRVVTRRSRPVPNQTSCKNEGLENRTRKTGWSKAISRLPPMLRERVNEICRGRKFTTRTRITEGIDHQSPLLAYH